MLQYFSKEGQHKQNKSDATVLDAREQLAAGSPSGLRHSATDWAGSHGHTLLMAFILGAPHEMISELIPMSHELERSIVEPALKAR